jgi:NAD(P)-dependent dehydrogenase (short-subunit alcohol dehydrogenase family)
MSDERPLDGSLAVVTGALGNLGPHWVSALAGAGARVVGVDLRTEPDGDLDPGCRLEQGDVTDRASLEAVRERIADLGPPDVLVNNAGIDAPPDAAARRHAIEDVPTEAFSGTLEVNLTGTFHAIQVFGSAMRDAGRGSIVNIGSLYASVAPDPELYSHLPGDPPFLKPPAYGASKAGVVSLTRYFARLWGPHGVRVNTLSPGGVAGGQDEEFVRRYCSRVPMRRMAEPQDLLGALLFLASEASRYVSGQELRVDGGFTA